MKSKVLIVDDSALARRTLRALLEEAGCEVEEATEGAQALERLALGSFDLVILDLVMTGMYGLDVLTQIRTLNPKARVLIVTADIQKTTASQAQAAGAAGILNKPVQRAQLANALNTILGGRDLWT